MFQDKLLHTKLTMIRRTKDYAMTKQKRYAMVNYSGRHVSIYQTDHNSTNDRQCNDHKRSKYFTKN